VQVVDKQRVVSSSYQVKMCSDQNGGNMGDAKHVREVGWHWAPEKKCQWPIKGIGRGRNMHCTFYFRIPTCDS
jgi:hypothetical protein